MQASARSLPLVALVVLTAFYPAFAAGPPEAVPTYVLSPDPGVANAEVIVLRSKGPEGLRLLLDAYRADVDRVSHGGPAPEYWERLRGAIDRVAGQRDAYASKLFWYTDLEAAKREATVSGRPILSLRLLGRLDEELSCANSRFFRTVLYANADVSRYLSEHFVLHWSSERPAPQITIDFGDGRKVVRTVTGNSVHYVLDARGRVVDALPGLYGPKAFVRALAVADTEARAESALDDATRAKRWRQYAADQLAAARRAWTAEIADARQRGELLIAPDGAVKPVKATALPPPAAASAGRLAITKMAVEVGSLRALDLETDPAKRPFDDAIWAAIANRTPEDAKLDEASVTFMRAHVPSSALEGEGSLFAATVATFERSIGVDTVRNEFVLRPAILGLLAARDRSGDFASANRIVYDDVFQTPISDPWLGLAPADAYTAIENGGVVVTPAGGEPPRGGGRD